MEDVIKKLLSEKRYVHSKGVAELSEKLAERLGVDKDKAYTAGIVHDIAKEWSGEKLLKYADEHDIELNCVERNNPFLLHGPVGAVLIREYGVIDEDIENAVRYHTVGRAGMSTLEKIIYLADMIEPSRKYDGVDYLRELCDKDFNQAFAQSLKRSVIFNLKKGNLIHEGTIYAWNDLLIGGMKIDG